MTKNESVLNWIENMKKLVNPDNVMWIDGSEEQLNQLRAEACSTGEMIKLNEEKLPGCYLHRTAVNDVAPSRGGQNLHLLPQGRGCRPHQQLDGAAGSV